MLDRVKEHAESLSRRVSAGDKSKLDEYLTSVREVEKRIQRQRKDQDKAVERATDKGKPIVMMDRPGNGLPEDIREHHSASHSDKSDDYERVTRYYVSQYAYLASKLDAMQEGDRTCSTILASCSSTTCGLAQARLNEGSAADRR